MATPRLPFLYPNLMRAVRSCEQTTYRPLRFVGPRQNFHTSRRREQEAYHRRYGPAVDPNIPPPSRPKNASAEQAAEKTPIGKNAAEKSEQNSSSTEWAQSQSQPQPQPQPQSQSQSQQQQQPQPQQQQQPQQQDVQNDAADAAAASSSEQAAAESTKGDASAEAELQEDHEENNDSAESSSSSSFPSSRDVGEEMSHMPPYANQSAFDEVYHMPSPSTYLTPSGPAPSGNKPPHLSPAPYVHHFDTYSLVLDLSKGGYTSDQAVTIMKAVRNILQNNIDFAKRSLTSKSDVENESYLFKAACSELQQSLQTARNSEVQRQRASRTHLEHEADILSQRLNQELAGMKDDIKGMFNDHKMATREQQRSIDTSVQELNYKITVSLNSDGKSEIEGLRWILTRRAALTIATCACKFYLCEPLNVYG